MGGPAQPKEKKRRALAELVRLRSRMALREFLRLSNRLQLPVPSVLPATGALVGVYSGLAAGIFTNLVGLASGLAFHLPQWTAKPTSLKELPQALAHAYAATTWNWEYAVFALPLALAALGLARIINPGGPRDLVKRRLRVLGLLTLGAVALYYPLVALSALNSVLGHVHDLSFALEAMPFWAMLLAPMLGGLAVGRLLRNHPEMHGHGVPEVVTAIRRLRPELPVEGGLRKLIASAITIGSGGSAGREGPIVYGGAAFGSAVGATLGFTRRELAILLACGAGAGIAASFNAPIAGAVFALEIILREFELRSFSPIVLASVTGTMVGRGTMGSAPMLLRLPYSLSSGWEIIAYAVLGLVCGGLAFAFGRLLHDSEGYFSGRFPGRLSAWLGRRTLAQRAAVGGLAVGLMAIASPVVWGTGHEFVNLAAVGKLSLWAMVLACALKVVATAVTIGSGGSGGTFFPATVIGAMGGGAFGALLGLAFPASVGPAGAYAMVGMGGVVAGLTHGPLTGMMMLYELSGNYQIILPLMVTCTVASATCHALRARQHGPDESNLRGIPVSLVMAPVAPVPCETRVEALLDILVASEEGVLPVIDAQANLVGLATLGELREVWKDETLRKMLNALDVARPTFSVQPQDDLANALALMDKAKLSALAVRGPDSWGVLTRANARRFLQGINQRSTGLASWGTL